MLRSEDDQREKLESEQCSEELRLVKFRLSKGQEIEASSVPRLCPPLPSQQNLITALHKSGTLRIQDRLLSVVVPDVPAREPGKSCGHLKEGLRNT